MGDYTPGSVFGRLCQALAEALGPGWWVDAMASHWNSCYLDEVDGPRLLVRDLSFAGPNAVGRLEIQGDYPEGAATIAPNLKRPIITVNGNRAPAMLARDITRRLLPDVSADMAVLHTKTRQQGIDRDARHQRRDQLAELLPNAGVNRENPTDTSSLVYSNRDGAGPHSTWLLDGAGDTVKISIGPVTYAEALRIAAALTQPPTA